MSGLSNKPIRYGVGASRNVLRVIGNAGMIVCCQVIGKSRDSIASKNIDNSLKLIMQQVRRAKDPYIKIMIFDDNF